MAAQQSLVTEEVNVCDLAVSGGNLQAGRGRNSPVSVLLMTTLNEEVGWGLPPDLLV